MPLMQQHKQSAQQPDLIDDLPDLKKELKSGNLNMKAHLGNIQVRLMAWIEKTAPEVAKELKELDKKDFEENSYARYMRGRSYNLAEFYLNLREMGMNDKSAKWWVSLFLERQKGGFLSSPKSPIENEYLAADKMMKMYDFIAQMFFVQKNPQSVDDSQKDGWTVLINRSKKYEEKNNSTGKNYANWLIEQIEEYSETQTAGIQQMDIADREAYAILKENKMLSL